MEVFQTSSIKFEYAFHLTDNKDAWFSYASDGTNLITITLPEFGFTYIRNKQNDPEFNVLEEIIIESKKELLNYAKRNKK